MLSSLPAFNHFLHYPQANWALLVLIPRWVGLCMFQDPVGLSNELSCEAGSFSFCLNSQRCFQSEVLRLYFPAVEPWVAWSVLLPPQLFLLVYLHANVGPPGLPSTTLLRVLSTPLSIFTPPTGLTECFFFKYLVDRLPWSSTFCQS